MDSQQERSPRKNPTKQYNDYLKYSGLAFQMMVVIGAATWGGYAVDQYLDLRFPAFTLAFLILSLIGVIYQLYRQVSKDGEK